jgi:hypothetical protein
MDWSERDHPKRRAHRHSVDQSAYLETSYSFLHYRSELVEGMLSVAGVQSIVALCLMSGHKVECALAISVVSTASFVIRK